MNGPDADVVKISIPADPRYIRSVRLVAGAVATLAGFDVEAIEDLRIGVDELCSALIEVGGGSELSVEISVLHDDAIRITGAAEAASIDFTDDKFALAQQILSVVADSYGFEVSGRVATCWLERTRTEWSGAATS